MACVGRVKGWKRMGRNIEDFPHLARWLNTLLARPAVEETSNILFGQKGR